MWLKMKDLLRGTTFSPAEHGGGNTPLRGHNVSPVWLSERGEIPPLCVSAATSSSAPCDSPDLSKWDKMFSMLENSQMRENMLLQYADDIIKVEIGSLRGEMLRLVHTSTQPNRKWRTSAQVQLPRGGPAPPAS